MLLYALLAIAFASSATQAIITAPDTFCTKYTGALFGNSSDASLQAALVSAVVVRAATGCPQGVGPGLSCTNPSTTIATYPAFKGLFAADSPVLVYFNGEFKFRPDVPDFTTNSTELGALVGHLVSFFGATLGCNGAGYPLLPPTRWSNLHLVHKNMNLTQEEFSYFNNAVLTSLRSFGAGDDDLLHVVAPLLATFGRCAGGREICTQDGCDIASPSRDRAGNDNIQPKCIVEENQRLTQDKLTSAILYIEDDADKMVRRYSMPALGLAATHFALAFVLVVLASVILHRGRYSKV